MENKTKYSAKLHQKAFGDFKFLGTVTADSIKSLKENAKRHARSWGNHGRIYLSEENHGLELAVNA